MDLEQMFPKVWRTNEGFRTLCPQCGDTKGKLYFNTEKRCGCCFEAGCTFSPSRGGVTESQLRRLLGNRLPDSPTRVIEQAEMTEVRLPEQFKQIADLKNPIRSSLYSYLGSRGLTRKIVDRMQVGYCRTGRHWGYLIFPVFNEDNEVVYWQGRRFKKRNQKFLNPKASYKSELLYRVGASKIGHIRKLVLVESIINALTIGWLSGRNLVVALLGSSLSDSQLHQLLSYKHVDEVIVALDGDMWKESVAIADRLLGCFHTVRIAKFPYDEDINALGREKSWTLLDDAILYCGERMSTMMSGDLHPWERKGVMTYAATIP